MQRFIYFFMMFALSLATDVYISNGPYSGIHDAETVFSTTAPWKFGFNSGDRLFMAFMYMMESPNVTAVTMTVGTGIKIVDTWNVTLPTGKNVPVCAYQFTGLEAIINFDLHTSNGLCTSIRVAEGRAVFTLPIKKKEKEYKYADGCFKESKPCVFGVHLKNFTCKGPSNIIQKNGNFETSTPLTRLETINTTSVSNVSSSSNEHSKTLTNSSATNSESNDQQPPPKNNGLKYMLMYVIPPVIGMCVILIILVIYLCVKNNYRRNSHPSETMELNTYTTTNEIVYADLSLMHGESLPPRCDEESPYAQIIGVLKPH